MKTTTLIIAVIALACGGFAQEEKKNPKEAVQKLLQQSREAKEAGRIEEAQKLNAEAERIMAELSGKENVKKKEGDGEKQKEGFKNKEGGKEKEAMKDKEAFKKIEKNIDGGKFFGKGPEAEKLVHMMHAVEHLRAAGMNEPAAAIEQAAQPLRQALEEQMKRQETEAHEKKGGQPGEKKAHGELDEMRQQMRKMAEQIEFLQGELKKRGS